jgi:gluconolactonase
MSVEVKIFDESFFELFDTNQDLKTIASDFKNELGSTGTNGPVWHKGDKCLYFNNIAGSRTFSYSEEKGLRMAFCNGLKSVGMCVAKDGRLIMCEHSTSSLVMRNTDGTGRKVLADSYGEVEFNGPHDVVRRSDGLIYFTDPIIGRNYNNASLHRPIPSEMRPVYMLNPVSGNLVQVAAGFRNPNGLCFSLDERIFYVVDSRPGNAVRAYDVKTDGTLENERIFIDLEFFSDGVKIDTRGNLVLAMPRYGLDWYSSEGTKLGSIYVPDTPMNMAWGDDDFKSLYITCMSHIFKLRTLVEGHCAA